MAFDPHTPSAAHIAGLGWTMIVVATVVCLLVFAYLALGLFLARRRTPRLITGSPVEVPPTLAPAGWANWLIVIGGIALPAIVLLFILGDTLATLSSVTAAAVVGQADGGAGPLMIDVIGHEWWWEVRYPDAQVTTANEVHLPTGRPVLFQLTSEDVIHSFWVPQLMGKVDLIPGHTNTLAVQAGQSGDFRGQCAEYCGLQHAHMIFSVIAQAPGDFDAWLAGQRSPAAQSSDALVQRGVQVFARQGCINCHTIRSGATPAGGTLTPAPDLTHLASRRTIAAGTLPNTIGALGGWIENSQAIKPGNKMPPMQLDGDDLQALLAYLETLQ